ncbi:MAG: hypothetical protein ABH857_05735 [Elusimicrobiota bacterium]
MIKSFTKIILMFFLVNIALFLQGCAAQRAQYYNNLDNLIVNEQFEEASNLVVSSKEDSYGKNNALLYYLDLGFTKHMSGNWEESNIAFERAKQIARDYFTKSITQESKTLLISDAMRPYYGEDFERSLINIFCALNYIFLDNEQAALVEARQVDHFLNTIQIKYGQKSRYKEDAFARYLMGMIYENQHEYNDAFISYRQAMKVYEYYAGMFDTPLPISLVEDAMRMAKRLKFNDEIREIESKYPSVTDEEKIPDTYGELVLFHYNGKSPVKSETIFEVSFGEAWIHVGSFQPADEEEADFEQAGSIARTILADEMIRISFPKYVDAEYEIHTMNANTDVGNSQNSFLVENIGAIAKKSLDDKIDRTRIRAIARAAIKFTLAKGASNKVEEKTRDKGLAWLTKKVLQVAANATEHADKRSWRSLPDQIEMVKMYLPEGAHDVHLNFKDNNGNIIETKVIYGQLIKRGQKSFAVVRTAK